MKFEAIDVPHLYGSLYRSEKYDLIHSECGFGIWKVRVFNRANQFLREFAGPGAMEQAKSYCRELG